MLSTSAPIKPETPSDLRLALSALTQEINTLLRHLDPRRPSRHQPRPELENRLQKLIQHQRLLLGQFGQPFPAGTSPASVTVR